MVPASTISLLAPASRGLDVASNVNGGTRARFQRMFVLSKTQEEDEQEEVEEEEETREGVHC